MKNGTQQFYHNLSSSEVEKIPGQSPYDYSSGLTIASAISTTSAPLVIITPDIVTSLRLEQELRFFLDKKKENLQIFNFPGWETLPYDHFSPHEDLVSQRLLALYQLSNLQSFVVFVAAPTLMHRLPPKDYIVANSFVLKLNEIIDFGSLRKKLESYGYSCTNKVMEHGEFAVRGSIIDIFPMGSKTPFRIDLFDDTVDSIRTFDPDTQRSLQTIEEIKLLPAKEFPLTDDSIALFCESWRNRFTGNPANCQLYQNVTIKKSHPGIEYYLPLFFANTATLFDYLPSNSVVITAGYIEKEIQDFWSEINTRYEQLRNDQAHPILPPNDIFITPEQLLSIKSNLNKIDKENTISPYFKIKKLDNQLLSNDPKTRALNLQQTIFKTIPNARTLFVASSAGRCEALLSILRSIEINPKHLDGWQDFIQSSFNIAITIAPIEQPLHAVLKDSGTEIFIITEAQIFGEHHPQRQTAITSTRKAEAIVHDLIELQAGAPVVHIDYGVGRYLGLQKLQINPSYEAEFLLLEYADNAKLYVPVTSFSLISRYTGTDAEHAPLNHLGSKQWEKVKRAAEEQIRDTAAELLEIYATRHKAQGFSFTKPEADYERFSTSFPFATTQDQQRAIDEVVADMTSSRPMDRLICGDVGFGKTEVAMRAAFLAVSNSKQVAILTPTTLLAQQHFANFQDRFAAWPVKVRLFSRFCNTKEQKSTVEDLASGKIDIVIGTHKLLHKDLQFKNLGLLIVDEEHRFGVKQKETIKQLAANVDILTLTATPIPRTLNMAFAGIRDFSIIATPPAKRLAIKTFVHEYDPYMIKEVILRETMRGGQVYFLHNDINTIEKTARELQHLVPTINVAIAHGQMRKQQLEQIMRDFYNLRTNVLVCTTIIESGLDVPTANAIIIDRADRFGLAQLHQIRGRVGRSHHQAYAYLVVPPKENLTPDAKKRLDAIVAMKDLGTGFVLATHDLEIRGAGELLGEKQSGVIQGIGFTLYMEMLEHAVKTLKNSADKNTEQPLSKSKVEIDLQISALIPDKYVSDVNQRLVLYKKIADANNQTELDKLQVELIDRFGLLPEQTKNLFKLATLKLLAQKQGITKITIGANKGIIEFAATCNLDPKSIIQFLRKHSDNFKFSGPQTIEFVLNAKVTKMDFVESLLSAG